MMDPDVILLYKNPNAAKFIGINRSGSFTFGYFHGIEFARA